MSTRLQAGVVATAVSVMAATILFAQQQKPPTFRARLELVQIDVTVLDSNRMPIRGLTIDDFTLMEDGEERPIRGFAEINIPDAKDGPAWMKDSVPDVRTADDGRIIVFLLDDAQTDAVLKPELWAATVRKTIGEFIDKMGPTDVAAVLCTFDKRCAQDFTNDHALLKAAVAKFEPKAFQTAGTGLSGRGSWQYDWRRQSAGVSGSVVKQLIAQPGRRKALVFATPNLHRRPAVWPPKVGGLNRDVTEDAIQIAFEEALRAKVTVYGLSPTRLAGLVDPSLLDPNAIKLLPGQRPPLFAGAAGTLAYETGGFTINTPELFSAGVDQVYRETGSYYLLGYEQQPRKPGTPYNPAAGYRSIDVVVHRPGSTVRARSGIVEPHPAPRETNPPAPVDAALAGILPKGDLPLRLAAAPFFVPGEPDAAVSLTIGLEQPPTSARAIDRIELQARAFTARGDARGAVSHATTVTVSARDEPTLTDLHAVLRLKPGQYAVRISAASERLGVAGSVYADVNVPDFSQAPLSMSGLVVGVLPAPQFAGPVAPPGGVPFVPTTLREFSSKHRVVAFVHLMQGGKGARRPVQVNTTIRDASDTVVSKQEDEFAADPFKAGAVPIEYELPIHVLKNGLHLLRIEAVIEGATMKREMRFAVQK